MRQHPWDSFFEALTNNAVSYLVSMGAYAFIINPLFNLHTDTKQNFAIVGIFTLISMARQFVIRRLFNGRSVYAAITKKELA